MAKKLSESARRKRVKSVLKPFRVTNGKAFRLGQVKPGDTRGVKSRKEKGAFSLLSLAPAFSG